MKPLIAFKLQPTFSSYDNTEKAYTLYDLKIAEELDGYSEILSDTKVRYLLEIKWRRYIECWVRDDYGNEALVFSICHEAELDIKAVEEIQTILNLFKNDMYRYVNKNKSMNEWLKGENIHVTI